MKLAAIAALVVLAAPIDPRPAAAQTAIPTHMIGAFNIDDPSLVSGAVGAGVQMAFHYDYHPGSELERAYRRENVADINGRISQLLWAYECHRVHTVVTVPAGAWRFCAHDLYPSMDDAALMAAVKGYLQEVAGDPTVRGYWVLDDWPFYDATARGVLIDIHRLITRYTPERPAICGFSALIIPGADEWQPSLADNFSPQGCDAIAFYVFADTVTGGPPLASRYNWEMPGLLARMETAMRARGWNLAATPLIGIPQAFGGRNRYDGSYQVVPSSQSLAAQTAAFCRAGATGIVFYAWDVSDYLNPQDPATNGAIAAGVREGITACRQIWSGSALHLTRQATRREIHARHTHRRPSHTRHRPHHGRPH
jgi:hypothetical protein